MYELNDLNPDVMRAELAYRLERLRTEHRPSRTGVAQRLRTRRHHAAANKR